MQRAKSSPAVAEREQILAETGHAVQYELLEQTDQLLRRHVRHFVGQPGIKDRDDTRLHVGIDKRFLVIQTAARQVLKPPALKGLKGELLKTARKTRVAAFTGQHEKQIAQARRVLHIGKKTDKLIKSITQPLEVGLDILDRVVLDRDEQRVHILVVQVECAAVDVRADFAA